MRGRAISEREALAKLRPKTRDGWHRIGKIGFGLALCAALVAAVFFFKARQREDIEQNWQSASATILDVQPRVAEQINSSRGGAMLYDVVILVGYIADGKNQQRWVRVNQPVETLEYAKLQALRWKGQQCVVHWKASDSDKVIADVS